ncbi:MAG: transcriptional repressor LexA [Spirochaetes bacterium]|nr:transcriptional repressor LexA [Spirochaetota bacterium]
MEKNKLTKAQHDVFEFIRAYMKENNLPPTYEEIADNFGFKSKNSVETHLQALERKGVIQRIEKKSRGIRLNRSLEDEKAHLIPLVGTVAAGTPLLAEENISEYLDLYKVFYSSSELFALNVKGESMIKAGIMDGDKVVVQKQPFIENGEIGVAVIDDEATVKRIFFEGDKVILKPENDEMEDIVIHKGQNNFLIAGKVIGVIRRMQ